MTHRRHRGGLRLGAMAWLGAAWLCTPTDVHADVKQQCVAAYEQSQSARNLGHLRVARGQAIICSQESCPKFLTTDCIQWLAEIEASLPTVVFEVRDATGSETTAARVLVDDEPLKERVDGKAVAVDPGEHTLRFELAGAASIEKRIVIREGEKNRKISVSFAPLEPSSPPAGEATDEATTTGAAPMSAYALGGLGVVGVGLFVAFGAAGKSEKGELEASCAPRCNADQVSAVRTKLLAADISLGVGVISLAASTFLFLSTPATPEPARAARLDVDWRALTGGGVATVTGSF